MNSVNFISVGEKVKNNNPFKKFAGGDGNGNANGNNHGGSITSALQGFVEEDRMDQKQMLYVDHLIDKLREE